MEKQDFYILLSPVKTNNNLKDISFTKGIAAVGQKIQNLLYTAKGDRPFANKIGTSLSSDLKYYGTARGALLVNNIQANITNAIKEVRNVSVSIAKGPGINLINVNIKFDYYSDSNLIKNNRLTLSINTIT